MQACATTAMGTGCHRVSHRMVQMVTCADDGGAAGCLESAVVQRGCMRRRLGGRHMCSEGPTQPALIIVLANLSRRLLI
jgi:hypothetical protein